MNERISPYNISYSMWSKTLGAIPVVLTSVFTIPVATFTCGALAGNFALSGTVGSRPAF